ncbi:MAG TPA: transcriptional regulator [Fimbriimonadaceae bacterium]|nr:transcriptional regulator [Fimbriimonadaceae bacterium]
MLGRLDDAFQSKVRLGIVAALVGAGSMDFRGLKRTLQVTDGNLASHLAYLERREFVRIEKSFVGRRPHTEVFLTEEGRLGFRQYIEALARIVGAAGELGA